MQRLIGTLLFIGLLGLFSCGNDNPSAGGNAPAQDFPVGLNLLTWRYLAQDAALIKGFELRYRTKVNVIVKPMRDIIEEASRGALNADVVLLPTLEDAVRLRNFNVLQPFFVDAFTNGNVDDRYLDNEGYYAGLTRWTMVSVYNPNAVTSEEAGSYAGIVKATRRGIRLGVAHPDSSGLAGVVAGLNANLNSKAAAIWAQSVYEKSVGGPNGSDTDQLNRMLSGQLDMAFVSLGTAVRWFLNGDPQHFKAAETWRVRFPHTQATDINFFNITCVAMPANAPNRNMAVALINYLFAKDVQQKLTNAWFEYPAESFTEANDYLYGFPDQIGLKVNAETIEQNIPAAWALINQIAEEQE